MHRAQQTEGQIQPDNNQIIGALNAVLESDKFTAAPQMSAFLKYVVEQAASGNMTRIKAYTVAIDALGKPDSFDPQNDPVVRVLAGRLRAALASYYEANPNVDLRIIMRPGSYVPSFVHRSAIEAPEKTNASSNNRVSAADAIPVKNSPRTSPLVDAPTIEQSLKRTSDSNESSQISNPTETASAEKNQNTESVNFKDSEDQDFATHFRWLFRLPTVGIALAALGIFVGSQLTHFQTTPDSENINTSANLAMNASVQIQRDRPQQVSLFVSALEQGNSLNDQLNTMLSGVFSESNSLFVYRVFDSSKSRQHWPEDYLVSVDVLPLPTETRISIQLIEAQTGKVSHSENIALSKNATNGLNGEELVTITEFARQLISEDGPLFTDYKTKLAAAN
jgi:hypothetical protein